MQQLIIDDYDPMRIEGCVFWLPHDEFRTVLPTGHRLQIWTCDPTCWDYVTHGGKKCLHHTAEPSGSYLYAWSDMDRPMTAGLKQGNGCTISFSIYGRTYSGTNPMQFFTYDVTQVSKHTSPTTNPWNSNTIILSPWFNSGVGGLNEYTSGEQSVKVVSSITNSYLTNNAWNWVQWTLTAAGAATLYVNGTQRGTGTLTRTQWIGASVGAMPNRQANGYFRAYRLYDRVLTTSQLTKLRGE